MTYPEALQYLKSFINYEKLDNYDYKRSFKLDRMKSLVSLLGDPQRGINAIHVAGTKGKGSTSAIIYSILLKSGFKAGLYTSPHLTSFRERIRFCDELISKEDVARSLGMIKEAVSKGGDSDFSFFEIYTALAYLYFRKKKADIVVYETGLGGRLDATNILEPLVCVLTPISYEHTDKLGNTLKEIAFEKAGIIKDGSICVTAPQAKEAMDVIEKVCAGKNAKLITVGKDITFKELARDDQIETFSVSGLRGEYPAFMMKLLGSHQVVNAATAIGEVEALHHRGIEITSDAVREGVASARWEGRLEVVAKRPYIVLDGAQNRASAKALTRAIKDIFRYERLILALGVSRDKDIDGILKELLPIADRVILTK